MAAAVVSAASNAGGGGGLIVPKPTGTVDLNLILACIHGEGSPTLPAGFLPLATSGFSGGGITLLWGYKVASSEGASYTFGSSSDTVAFLLRVDGHDPTITITQVAGVAVASGSGNAVCPSIPAPPGADALLVCSPCHDGDTNAAPGNDLNWTPPGSMTEWADRHSGGWTCGSIASEQLASDSATGTRTFVPASTSHRAGAAGTIAIKSAGGAASVSRTILRHPLRGLIPR